MQPGTVQLAEDMATARDDGSNAGGGTATLLTELALSSSGSSSGDSEAEATLQSVRAHQPMVLKLTCCTGVTCLPHFGRHGSTGARGTEGSGLEPGRHGNPLPYSGGDVVGGSSLTPTTIIHIAICVYATAISLSILQLTRMVHPLPGPEEPPLSWTPIFVPLWIGYSIVAASTIRKLWHLRPRLHGGSYHIDAGMLEDRRKATLAYILNGTGTFVFLFLVFCQLGNFQAYLNAAPHAPSREWVLWPLVVMLFLACLIITVALLWSLARRPIDHAARGSV